MTKNSNTKDNDDMQHRQQLTSSSRQFQYYFIAAAAATAIDGIIHLLMPLHFAPQMLQHFATRPLNPIFFLGSGIAQTFWILPMIQRWGKVWYYIGIAGNIAFIILYIITRLPWNPVTGREGDVDIVDMACELAQVAYIAVELAKERTANPLKISQRQQIR
jgi:hypothetical protein